VMWKPRYVVAVGLAVAATALLAGCGGSAKTTAANGSSGGSTAKAGAGRKVAIVAAVQNPTQVTEMCAARGVLRGAGFDASIQYPSKYDPSLQIPILNAVLNTRPAGLLLTPADPHALLPLVKRAVNAGTKVVTLDTGVVNPASAGVASAVTANDVAAGMGAADLIGKTAKGRQGEVALITFSPGAASVADDRARGFETEIKKYPSLRYIGKTIADSPTDAAAKTNALAASHPNLVAILGDWTGASEGMIQALKQRGLTGKVISVANDGDAPLIAAIRAGDLYGSVFPRILDNGATAAQQLVDALTGKPTTATIGSLPVTATKANLDDPGVSKFFLKEGKTC
jgi:ABC-type sugar transport system substrate-binding protein